MKLCLTRRNFIVDVLLAPLLQFLDLDTRAEAAATLTLEWGPMQAFSFDWLRDQAGQLAAQPYQAPTIRYADMLEKIDFDAYQQIRYQPEVALWAQGDGPYPVQFFHLGKFFKVPVKIYAVRDGMAREILYSPKLFDFGKSSFAAAELPSDIGFAGFRIMHSSAQQRDWLAFLGASYFRSSGELDQYGLSARGIAIDTGLPTPEEFPRFTGFWLEPAADPETVVIYALLDGPSIAGAYRIEAVRHTYVVMNVAAALFARTAINRMGIAPMTSMFWFSETNRMQGKDWRPEVHDNDGLSLWTGSGERLWRPLNNPLSVQTSSFFDINPKGFGLLQRDRNFENYQDDSVFYDRRPSLWVEPLEPWGEGAVQLVEIPTDDEIDDNIVVYWVPKTPVQAGSNWNFKYRLHWVADEPYPPALGRVIATRLGRGGIPGVRLHPANKVKLVIDFAGGPLEALEKNSPVKLVVSAVRGKVDNDYCLQVVGTKRWRAFFDIEVEKSSGPFDIRAYLRLDDQALTETWLYRFIPRYHQFLI
jgi:glucans biosynthesis protein